MLSRIGPINARSPRTTEGIDSFVLSLLEAARFKFLCVCRMDHTGHLVQWGATKRIFNSGLSEKSVLNSQRHNSNLEAEVFLHCPRQPLQKLACPHIVQNIDEDEKLACPYIVLIWRRVEWSRPATRHWWKCVVSPPQEAMQRTLGSRFTDDALSLAKWFVPGSKRRIPSISQIEDAERYVASDLKASQHN